jgi:hypothetical protein
MKKRILACAAVGFSPSLVGFGYVVDSPAICGLLARV